MNSVVQRGKPAPSERLRRVLVIDDDEIARETMVELLEVAGHSVASLPSPIGATKAIIDSKIEVLVLDVMMPSIRGDKLAALLNKNPRLAHLAVVLVTGANHSEMVTIAKEVGAAALVPKSGVHTQLENAVRRAGRSSFRPPAP